MKLYNTATRALDPIDDEEALHQALLTGTHSFEAGAAIDVTSPDGERGTVPSENVGEAVRAGYKVETPSQRAVREYVDEHKGLKSALGVGLGQLADEAALGLPELIMDKTADPLQVAKKEALKKEHELANLAGGIAGFAGSLFLGGPLWKGAAKAGEKTAAMLAEKLAVTSGEEVAKRTLSRAAKDVLKTMAAKSAGAGVEGAVVSMPHAITEAALGDPDDAAETVLAGVGVGSLLGGGGVLAKELFSLGKNAVTKGAELVTQQAETTKSLARKAAKVLTGVNEEDVLHYIENADRVNAALPREEIMDAIDGAVAKRRGLVDATKENLAVARSELQEAARARRYDLATTRAPEGMAKDIMGDMESVKGFLGSLSEQADDALERSGLTFRRDDLVAFLDDVGGAIGVQGRKGERVLVSDEAVAAAGKLKAQRDRIASFDDIIDAPALRGVLRDVRKDIKWNQLAGEFNDTLNKARKTFQERISTVLKDSVPEYSGYMGRMRELADNLERMVPVFGDEKRAIGALNSLSSPTGKVNQEILAEFGRVNGKDYLGTLDEMHKARELVELGKREDIADKLAPELHAKVKRLEADLAQAELAYEPMRRLSDERTQGIIRNQGFKNASIKDRRALEELGAAEGQDFMTMIQDRNVLDAFAKGSTQGSRKTLLGTLLGGAVGGPMGMPVGGAVGAVADVYGGAMLKRAIDANRDVSGLLFSEKAMKRAAEQLDEIPDLLDRMARRVKPKNARAKASYAIQRLLGDEEGKGRETTAAGDRHHHLERLNTKAAVLVSNPAAATQRLSEIIAPLERGGAPGIAAAFSRKASVALNYLHQSMPRPPRPRSPFAPKVVYHPPAYELAAYEDKVQVAADPWTVLTELEHGTLTRAHVDALKVIYPGLHRMIRDKVQDAVVSGVAPLAYGQRAKLSLLLDAPMDTSLTPEAIAYYQEPYVAASEAEGQGGGVKVKVDVADSMLTQADRLLSRKGG